MFTLFTYRTAYADVYKWIKVGKYWSKVVDSGNEGESFGTWEFMWYYFDDFAANHVHARGWQIGVRDWTDENGEYWPVKISGAAHGTANEVENTMPVPDEEEITIRKYRRFQPPAITVDGFRLDDPFPMTGEEVNPDKIPGTADVMVESWINTDMGVTIHQRALGWSQTHHDDYIIYDCEFINTGNVDLDDEIEIHETLNDLYFIRENAYKPGGGSAGYGYTTWESNYGEFPGDSMRMMYGYPSRTIGSDFDNLGDVRMNGFIRHPEYKAQAWLHVPKSVDDNSDDITQPGVTGYQHIDYPFIKLEAHSNSAEENAQLYDLMKNGFFPFDGSPDVEGTYPGHHSARLDDRGYEFLEDFPWFCWLPVTHAAAGPWTLEPGDSIRIVWADVMGSITPEKAWEVGRVWKDGTAIPPEGCVFGVTDNMPPQYKVYPELYAEDYMSSEYNNWAKDCWVFIGKDSLFTNTWNAQWNVRHNYEIPIPPPAPSIEVSSKPDKVLIEWGNESEAASDFAGYRVYRAIGNPGPTIYEDEMIGVWNPIFECGEGTDNALTHSYEDKEAKRGKAYYYYVAAFDNGVDNVPDVGGQGESLESGRYLNLTTKGAYLTRPSVEELSRIRVVPNPFNIGAGKLQYPGEPDKIMFMNLPPVCTIKIYSESGDLVRTIEHTDGSGDEAWKNPTGESFQTSSSGQIVVSGLYIAHIVTPDGMSTNVKFFIVR